MAEHDIEEKIESLRRFQKEIGPCEVITGGIVSNKGPAGRPGGPSVLQRKGTVVSP